MNENDFFTGNSPTRRTYIRRKGKNNRTTLSPYLINTSTILTTLTTTNQTLINANPAPVPVNDLFAPLSYFFQHKIIFLLVSSFLLLLCIITICFLVLLKCSKSKSWQTRERNRLDKERLKTLPDFLDDQNDHKNETDILLEPNGCGNSLCNNAALSINGVLLNDNVSTTFSLEPILVEKIDRNNPPNTITTSSIAGDDTSLDTLRGSLISSRSQQISSTQPPSTPTTTTDSIIVHPDERAVEAEKDDGLNDLEFKPNQTRYIKAVNSNLFPQRSSTSSLEQTIRQQERKADEEEHKEMHGSKPNLYEHEIKELSEQAANKRKQHTNSQVSLVSRTSEDSCY